MDATLKLSSNALAYADLGATSNPLRRYVDWSAQRTYAVKNPKAEPFTVDPGASLALFSGVRTTSADVTTELQLTLSPLDPSRYRMTWTSAGTAPAFRVARSLALSGHAVTMTANNNQTLSMAATAGDFAAVQVGDTLLIPDTITGDAPSPFSALNVGYWIVLAKDGTSTTLQLVRPTGQAFSAVTEVVTPVSNAQVVAYSAGGVQVGDRVVVNGTFPSAVKGSYTVAAVTPTWFEFIATSPLPSPVNGVGISFLAPVFFYSNAKRWIRIEFDQRCSLQLNGLAGQTLEPWAAGDADNTGFFEMVGPVWSATVVNLSSVPLNFLFLSVE